MKKIEKYQLFLAFGALLVSVALLLVNVSRNWLNSDALYMEAILRDLIGAHGRWGDWKFAPASDFFPDLLIYLAAYKLLPSAMARVCLVSAVQVCMLTAASCWLVKAVNPAASKRSVVAIILVVAYFTFASGYADLFTFFYSTNGHFGALLFAIVALAMAVEFVSRPTLFAGVMIFAINILASVSTKIYFLSFIIPAITLSFCALVFGAGVRAHVTAKKSTLLYLLVVNTVSLLAVGKVYDLIFPNDALGKRVAFTAQAAFDSERVFLGSLQDAFSLGNRYRLVLTVFVCACLVFLFRKIAAKKIFSPPGTPQRAADVAQPPLNRVGFAVAFLFFIIPISVLGTILSGGYIDPEGFRYFAAPIAISVILAVAVADRDGHLSGKTFSVCATAVSVILIGGAAAVFARPQTWPHRPPPLIGPTVDCLREIETSGFSLRSGVADYWNARGVSNHLSHKNWIVALQPDMTPLFWMSSLGPVRRAGHYDYAYNFVIVRNPGDPILPYFTTADIGKLLPVPDHIMHCVAGHTQIWLYDDDTLDRAIKQSFERFEFLRGEGDTYEEFGSASRGVIGRVTHAGRVAEEKTDQAGMLSYGPYLHLQQGRYEVAMEFSLQGGDGLSYIDIIGTINGKPGVSIFSTNIHDGGNQTLRTVVDVDAGGVRNFEVRSWFSGKGTLLIRNLRVRKIS